MRGNPEPESSKIILHLQPLSIVGRFVTGTGLLVCATEVTTPAEIEQFAAALATALAAAPGAVR